MHRQIALLLLLGMLVVPLSAQGPETQICVRSFEDRNGNGQLDVGEFIQQDVSAELINADGVVIRTLSLQQSERAESGLMCVEGVPYGTYTLDVISAVYEPVTVSRFEVSVDAEEPNALVFFGARLFEPDLNFAPVTANPQQTTARPNDAGTAANTEPETAVPTGSANGEPIELLGVSLSERDQREFLERLFFGSVAAAIVMGGMFITGLFLYAVLFYPRMRRYRRARAAMQATGTMPPANKPPTGGTQRVPRQATDAQRPVAGQPPTPKPGKSDTTPQERAAEVARLTQSARLKNFDGTASGAMTPLGPPAKPDDDTGPLQPMT